MLNLTKQKRIRAKLDLLQCRLSTSSVSGPGLKNQGHRRPQWYRFVKVEANSTNADISQIAPL